MQVEKIRIRRIRRFLSLRIRKRRVGAKRSMLSDSKSAVSCPPMSVRTKIRRRTQVQPISWQIALESSSAHCGTFRDFQADLGAQVRKH